MFLESIKGELWTFSRVLKRFLAENVTFFEVYIHWFEKPRLPLLFYAMQEKLIGNPSHYTKKNEVSIKDFLSKYDQIRNWLGHI